jgi:NAD(P)-dependent dehydrogenase (short-subunit alcohol dehydrogenase family)
MGIEIRGKVALITGGAQGIGLAIAEEFLNAKARVALADVNQEVLKETTSQLARRFPARVRAIVADVSQEQDIKKMVKEAVDEFGAIDILVNNAGFSGLNRFWEMPSEEWDKSFAVNLRAAFLCSREVVNVMQQKGIKGRIINISSINSTMPTTGLSAYCASKAGLEMFTRVAAVELGPLGINVNAIAPGVVVTPLTEMFLGFPGVKDSFLERTPRGRLGQPQDVAKVALFLASEYAEWITGQTIVVDGGLSLMGVPKYYEAVQRALGTNNP